MKLILICLGGALGTGLRYCTYLASRAVFTTYFPVATLLVNTLGSFLIGLLLADNFNLDKAPTEIQTIITIGILGGFTTFAVFSYEALYLWRNYSFMAALLYIFAMLLFGLVAVYLGIWYSSTN